MRRRTRPRPATRDDKYQHLLNHWDACIGEVIGPTAKGYELLPLTQQARKAGYRGKDRAFMRPLNKFDREIYRPWRAAQAQRSRSNKEAFRRLLADREQRQCAV